MFGSWAFGSSSEDDLLQKERPPPPAPTVLQFPSFAPTPCSTPLTSESFRNLVSLVSSIRTPRDLTNGHLESLNLHIRLNIPFAELVPEQAAKEAVKADRRSQVIKEIQTPNDTAFREILRLPPIEGQERVRLAHSRKFFMGLEQMSQFWDTSCDQFYEVPDIEAQPKPVIEGTDIRPASSPSPIPQVQPTTVNEDTVMRDLDNPTPEDIAPVEAKMKTMYKGRRVGAGKDMPEEYRDDTIRGLAEAVAWEFGCQVVIPTQGPRLAVGKLLIPVRHSYIVGRSPKDRVMARKGILEGPVLAVQCRGETTFSSETEEEGAERKAEIGDLLREVSAMLLLAEERAREGKISQRPGEGEWWTSKARWGGGPGGPMGWEEALQNHAKAKEKQRDELSCDRTKKRPLSEAEVDRILEEPDEKQSISTSRRRPGYGPGQNGTPSKGQKRNPMAEKWKVVRPGPGLWDKRMQYMRIGADIKTQDGVFDDIYLVSSINHHVSVLKLRVSDSFLAWMSGCLDASDEHVTETASILQLSRTRWFDLFDVADRVEVIQGLWEVMGWLLREKTNDEQKA